MTRHEKEQITALQDIFNKLSIKNCPVGARFLEVISILKCLYNGACMGFPIPIFVFLIPRPINPYPIFPARN
jgi:hypothetical protein